MLLNIIEALRQWAQEETSIESVILVGSWARGTNRPDSDMDLCILTARRGRAAGGKPFPIPLWEGVQTADRILRGLHLGAGLV